MFYDILVLVIILVCVLIGVFRGAIRTLVSLLISLGAYFLSAFLSGIVANWIYARFIYTSIQSSVDKAVAGINFDSAADSVNKIIDSLPSYVKAVLSISGADFSSALDGAKASVADSVVSAVDSAVKGIIVSFIEFFVSIIFFLVLIMLFRFIARHLVKPVSNLPGVRTIDRVFGLFLGLVRGFLLVSFVAFIWRLILPYLGNLPEFLSEESVNNSLIFKIFYNGNIFTSIVNAITGV